MANLPALFAAVFVLVFLIPQFFASLPGLPGIVRPTDLVGVFCLGLYAVLRLTVKSRLNPIELLLLLFLLWSFVVSAAGVGVISLLPRYSRNLGLEQALYPIRHLFIFGPALLAFALKPPRRTTANGGGKAQGDS